MARGKFTGIIFFVTFFVISALTLGVGKSLAQSSLMLSKSSDFSTNDRVFSRTDTLFMKVTAPDIDFTEIDKNEFRLKAESGGDEVEGKFINQLNGTFTAKVALNSTDPNQTEWEVRTRIRDKGGNEFEAEVEIKIFNNMEIETEIEVKGKIELLGTGFLKVQGATILVSSNTSILNDRGEIISFTDLEVGQTVEIKAFRDANGNLTARRIRVKTEIFDDDEIELTGLVTEVGADFVTVAGFRFEINSATTILDDNNNPVALADIKVGFIVEIRGVVNAEGKLVATKIEIEDRFADVLQITGEITNLTENTLTVRSFVFVVTDSTVILDHENNLIAFSALQLGMNVEIRAKVQIDGSLIATKIKVENRFENEFELTGVIENIAGDSLVVSGFTFLVNASTVILDNDKVAINLADLTVGQIVEVKALKQPDGTLLATKIEVEDKIEDEVEATGVIESITANSVVLLGLNFRVTSNTVILDSDERPISFAVLSVGQKVKIRGDLLGDGTLIAIKIKIKNDAQNEIEVEGPIEKIEANIITVLNSKFVINVNTVILDENGLVITLSDLRVGQTVKVHAIVEITGTKVATRVKIKDVVVMSGAITELRSNSVVLLNSEFKIDANTLILAEQNRIISFSDLKQGQGVEVRAERQNSQNSNEMIATKIKSQESSVVTGIGSVVSDGVNVPSGFALHQNYPNPFNPTTTITFEIPNLGHGAVQTEVTIYNLLGQAVRTLVHEPLNPGSHQKQWDGRDDQGNILSSGVYLYRLKAGSFSQTRRMLLIK